MFKKIGLILFLVNGISFATAITSAQVQQAQAAANASNYAANQLQTFLNTIQPLANGGWTFSVPGSTDTVTATAQQQSDILSQYETLKTNLQNAVLGLP